MLGFYAKNALCETVYDCSENEPNKLTVSTVYKSKQKDVLIECIKALGWTAKAFSDDGGFFYTVVAENPKKDGKKLFSKLYQMVKRLPTQGD